MRTIEKNAILVELSISQWTGRKFDRALSTEYNMDKGAQADAARVHKSVVDPKLLKPVGQAAWAIRRYLEANTLPWADNGQRILPIMRMEEFRQGFEELKAEFNAAVEHFVNNYRTAVRAEATRLGALFNLGDYPPPAQVRARFEARLKFYPIPASNDFRVEFDQATMDLLRHELEQELEDKTRSILSGLWQEVGKHLTIISERLGDPDARFRREIIHNARNLLLRIDDMNIFDDPNLSALATETKELCKLLEDHVELRNDGTVRHAAAQEAERVVAEFDDLW